MTMASTWSCRLHRFLVVAGLIMGMASAPLSFAQAQAYPSKPIRIVVGFAAGGPADIIARVLGAKLGETLGQQVVVENRTGAGGTIATEAVARADPDGYTLLMTPVANAVNETLFPNLRARFGEHLAAVVSVAETANVLVVHPSFGVKSVPELIALARAKPGEILYATAGRGTATHLTSELFNMMAGTKLNPLHYRGGGDVVKDLLSGEVKLMFSSIAPVIDFVKEGRLIGLATTGPQRDPALPDLPTLAEALPGFDMRLWLGVLAPLGTPQPVIDKLSSATAQALAADDVKQTLASQGFRPLPGTSQDFAAFYRSEVEKWAKVIKATGITAQ
jgi:tripartite-type tricarboxylate transporter receptor subunit TctC